MKYSLHSVLSTFLFGAWTALLPRETPVCVMQSKHIQNTRFEHISVRSSPKLLRSFINVFFILILNFLSLQNILFLEGAGTFLWKSSKPLKTSKCMRFGQFCTKPFTSFCVVFIKTFWTFLSLQNIYLEKGTAYLNLMRALLLLLLRNIIETASLMGTKGSMISQLLHQSY